MCFALIHRRSSRRRNIIAIVVPSVVVPIVVLGALSVALFLLLRRRRRRARPPSVLPPPGESFLPAGFGAASPDSNRSGGGPAYAPVAREEEEELELSPARSPHPFAYSPTEPATYQAQWVPAEDTQALRPSHSNRRTMRVLRALADSQPLKSPPLPEQLAPVQEGDS